MRRSAALAGATVLTLALASPAAADYFGGTDGRDELRGTSGADFMEGHDGDDLLYGRGGVDDIRGGDGDDHIFPGGGLFNSLVGEGGDDHLYGGPGQAYLEGGYGDDVMFGGKAPLKGFKYFDYATGGDGADRISLSNGTDGAEPDDGPDIVRLGAGGDFVYLYRDISEPGGQSAVDHIFCGPGKRDRVDYRGARDFRDVIDSSCERIEVEAGSREAFVERVSRAAHGEQGRGSR